MGSIFSSLSNKKVSTSLSKGKEDVTQIKKKMPSPTFSHYPNAQSDFKPPLIANGNAFLGDVFSSEKLSPQTPISAGFFNFQPGPELVYTYTYDEMKIILDGDFQISQSVASASSSSAAVKEEGAGGEGEGEANGGSAMMKNGEEIKGEKEGEGEVKEVEAGKGDVFFFPKGAVITFRTRQGGLAWYCGQRGKDAA